MKDPNNTSEEKVTAPALYFNRQAFIRAGILAASAVATGEIYRHLDPVANRDLRTLSVQSSGSTGNQSAKLLGESRN